MHRACKYLFIENFIHDKGMGAVQFESTNQAECLYAAGQNDLLHFGKFISVYYALKISVRFDLMLPTCL